MLRNKLVAAALVSLSTSAVAHADFMDILMLVPGGPGVGSFTGTLDGVAVTGSITVGPGTAFNPDPGPAIGGSTIGNTSPQHSYPLVYFPTKPISDRVGFSSVGAAVSHVSIVFGSPRTNPVVHVANLDVSVLDFTTTAGLGPMVLLIGNGAGGDGLAVAGPTIIDLLPATIDLTPHTAMPPLGGPRSAYGSVMLVGTFLAIDFDIITPAGLIENATFTLSSVPEPSSLILGGMAGLSVLGTIWYRRRKAAHELSALQQ